jgi:hypothetical protein
MTGAGGDARYFDFLDEPTGDLPRQHRLHCLFNEQRSTKDCVQTPALNGLGRGK